MAVQDGATARGGEPDGCAGGECAGISVSRALESDGSPDAAAGIGTVEWTEVARQFERVGRFCRLMVQRNLGYALSGAEVEVLTHLVLSRNAATPGSVARETGIGKEAMSRLLRGLVDRGLVDRVPNPGDGRSVLLRVSPAGRAELDRTYQAALRPMYTLMRGLGRADYDRLMELVDRAGSLLDGQAGRKVREGEGR